MKLLRHLFLTNRFFYGMSAVILVMMLSYALPILLPVAKTILVLFLVICLIDMVLLFNRRTVLEVTRETAPVLSLGDDNEIILLLRNLSSLKFNVEVIDELPEQFQERKFRLNMTLGAGEAVKQLYFLRPLTRGEYRFGHANIFFTSIVGLVKRRITFEHQKDIPVYPSIIQMRKYELKSFDRSAREFGVKKVRRIGHSYEFEHIKQYVRGDDYRSINWKATGRRSQLMVNQYEDEKSQPVYCIIDKSRVMHMPFAGLSLFDYAVNASLVISNIVLGKQDKAGLITFAETPKAIVKAERSKTQLKKILEALYKEREGSVEANYEGMYMTVRKVVTGRSLLFLYTNFESTYALQRVLPQLRKLNDQHLLVVVFFENTEVRVETSSDIESVEDIYTQITAEQYAYSKVQIAQQLRQLGIFSVLTKPENLTVNMINKYLELKSRGMI
jgi:uncharacterized protein (DUF58 family)